MNKLKVLLTGFDAFGGNATNPSEEVVLRLKSSPPFVDDLEIRTNILPTKFAQAGAIITEAIDEALPDVVVMLGYSATAQHILLERFALNIVDCEIADNDGAIYSGKRISEETSDALTTSIDLTRLCKDLNESGIPCKASNHAGTYVCNFVYYTVLNHLMETGSNCEALFVHIPPPAAFQGRPGSDVSLLEAIEFAIKTLLQNLPKGRSPESLINTRD